MNRFPHFVAAGEALTDMTRGALGATLYRGDTAWNAWAPSIAVRDAAGAGDASVGGLLFSLLCQPASADSEHLRFAGAAPPDLAHVLKLLELTVARPYTHEIK
ncbi:MAG: PfkB family carbohydrate kinase [Pseudomonadota bacterium]